MWSSHLSVNPTTGIFYTEPDCTYTVISVPTQAMCTNRYKFLFKLSQTEMIGICMVPNLSFIFSGLCLVHRQVFDNELESNDDAFLNVSSYGKHKICTYLRK